MVRVWMVAAALALSGCYQYRPAGPVDTVAPAAGSRVALRLTDQGAAQLAPQLGSQITAVEGEVLEADSTGFALAVVETEDTRRITTGWRGERVVVPRQYIASVQERRFSPGATGLFGALVVGGLAGAYALFNGEGLVEGPIGGGPSPGQQ